jgi:tRNA threonylcarbamoyladenosine biosynthesis protein TsaB
LDEASMKILALSTSTHRGSAAVLDGDRVIGASGYADLGGHAERIFSAVTEALDAAGTTRSDIELVATDIGPGSFTGVRVGVASAKGLALGLGVPLVGVGSLEAMAAAAFATGAAGPQDVVVSVLDAKKQEFFLAAYDASGQTLWAPAHLPIAESANIVWTELSRLGHGSMRICVVGEAALLEPTLAAAVVRGAAVDLPDAVAIGRLGQQRFASSKHEVLGEFDAAVVEPSYVRPPDAKPMASGVAS